MTCPWLRSQQGAVVATVYNHALGGEIRIFVGRKARIGRSTVRALTHIHDCIFNEDLSSILGCCHAAGGAVSRSAQGSIPVVMQTKGPAVVTNKDIYG